MHSFSARKYSFLEGSQQKSLLSSGISKRVAEPLYIKATRDATAPSSSSGVSILLCNVSEALCEDASEVVRLLAQRFLVDGKLLAVWPTWRVTVSSPRTLPLVSKISDAGVAENRTLG
jgi:hypothetical protein